MVAPAMPIGAAGGHSPGKDAANCEPDGAIVERHLKIQAGCALVARLLAAARVFEIAVKAGYVSC